MCVDYNQFLGYGAMNVPKPEKRYEHCPKCNKKLPVTWVQQLGTLWGGHAASNWFMYLPKH